MSGTRPQGDPLVRAIELSKTYPRGRENIHALDRVSFAIHRGEFLAIAGPSGAGKTTLLHLIGCMDTPTSGQLFLSGHEVHNSSDRQRTLLRRDKIGFVFQHFGLIPTLTVEENVGLPAFFARRRDGQRAALLLEKVGLAHRRDHRPHELSGGEMQRVAIARALMNAPELLLADEPTGNLDTVTGESIISLFRNLCSEGLTIAVVTHNPALTASAQRQLHLRDGRLAT